jgi:7-alpha-hydroxysteroid dehydrogenase
MADSSPTSMAERFQLDGRAAIVTGAGRGIGAACAVALAQMGADVVISARSAEQLAGVVASVEELGRRAVAVPADLSDLDAVPALAAAAVEAFGRIDIVVNNVGGTTPRPFMDSSVGFMARAFSFNVLTAHALTQAAVPTMLAGDGGSIVNISSAMGRLAGRGYAAYGTAKGALSHWTELAAADLAPRIRVNGIEVGSIATSALEIVTEDEAMSAEMAAGTLVGRIGDPEDIAATVVWLSSPAAAYVTGKLIAVDGGLQRPNLDLGFPDL